jgi:hypothetical protein
MSSAKMGQKVLPALPYLADLTLSQSQEQKNAPQISTISLIWSNGTTYSLILLPQMWQ